MIKELLYSAVLQRASDIHIAFGAPPAFRINGYLTYSQNSPLTVQNTLAMFQAIAPQDQQTLFRDNGEIDFSFEIEGLSRFRVNAFQQRGTVAMAIRVINNHIRTLHELGMPDIVAELAGMPRGLILVTGPAGSGKSTTLAAMVDLINKERAVHIVTLEDPIEYMHQHCRAIVNQREIPTDSKSFVYALKAALRQDPDVILVGEMRDGETIATAVTAAETGHLVLATLHTCDCAQSIDRIIDAFPSYQQTQIRCQLAMTIQGVISQQLLPRLDGHGRVAAVEILVAIPAVRNLIREGKSHQLAACIQTGARYGMQSMDVSLKNLYRSGIITYEKALRFSMNPETFIRLTES